MNNLARFVVFASGKGSNFIRLHEYFVQEAASVGFLACLVSDKPDCPAVSYAREKQIPSIILDYKSGSKEALEKKLLEELAAYKADLLVLAGFMRLLGPSILEAFPQRIINLHPSLLPKYPGSRGIEKSFESKDSQLGITIHYVDAGLDTGQIIVQRSFSRLPDDSLETISSKIHALEHKTYPVVVKNLLTRKILGSGELL